MNNESRSNGDPSLQLGKWLRVDIPAFCIIAICILAAAALAIILFAIPAHAKQAEREPLLLVNQTKDPYIFCRHPDEDMDRNSEPLFCGRLDPGKSMTWVRPAADVRYLITRYRPKFYDMGPTKENYVGQTPMFGFLEKIDVSGYGTVGLKDDGTRKGRDYHLLACNKTQPVKVSFVFGAQTDQLDTTGWWDVEPGKCIRIRLARYTSVEVGEIPVLYYYAIAYTPKVKYWQDLSGGRSLCIDRDKAFNFRDTEAKDDQLTFGPGCNYTAVRSVKLEPVIPEGGDSILLNF